MPSFAQIQKHLEKEFGEGVVHVGVPAYKQGRVPTGFFALDLATGGGFRQGYGNIVYGPEGSAKTTIALKAIAMHQILWPDKVCVFIDAEGEFDESWARFLGVDVERLGYILPNSAEDTIDQFDAVMEADDIGLVVIDSLAALITSNEIDSSASKAIVGGASNPIAKMYRKATHALNDARRSGRQPTVLFINQIRYKIGGPPMGNPEVMPGGKAPLFFSNLTLRMYGKDINDAKVSTNKPAWKEISGIIKKQKRGIVATNFKVKMSIHKDTGVPLGHSYDWPTIRTRLKELELLVPGEKKGSWVCLGQEFEKQDDLKELIATDVYYAKSLKDEIFKRML